MSGNAHDVGIGVPEVPKGSAHEGDDGSPFQLRSKGVLEEGRIIQLWLDADGNLVPIR